jgi:hypothetical protein
MKEETLTTRNPATEEWIDQLRSAADKIINNKAGTLTERESLAPYSAAIKNIDRLQERIEHICEYPEGSHNCIVCVAKKICDHCGDVIVPGKYDDFADGGFNTRCDTCGKKLIECHDCFDNSDDCVECEERREKEQWCPMCDMPTVAMTPEERGRHVQAHKDGL